MLAAPSCLPMHMARHQALAQPRGTGPADFFETNMKNCQSSLGSSLMIRTPCELMPCVGVELKLSRARTSFGECAVAVA